MVNCEMERMGKKRIRSNLIEGFHHEIDGATSLSLGNSVEKKIFLNHDIFILFLHKFVM